MDRRSLSTRGKQVYVQWLGSGSSTVMLQIPARSIRPGLDIDVAIHRLLDFDCRLSRRRYQASKQSCYKRIQWSFFSVTRLQLPGRTSALLHQVLASQTRTLSLLHCFDSVKPLYCFGSISPSLCVRAQLKNLNVFIHRCSHERWR